ncbi:cell division protein FtsA [candidate division KSB1 bacterium]
MSEQDIIVGIDIGTTKICVVVAEIGQFNEIKVLAVGTSPSEGLRRGVVINLDKTVQSIEKAVEEAELIAGVDIHSAYAGIAGDHIRSLNSRGIVAVAGDNGITQADIQRAIDAAKAISLPMDREIVHILPQEFILDDQSGIRDPIGMSGVRLEVEAHIVTGAVTSAQNIYKSVERAGLEVKDLVLEPLASSHAVLGDDERELGVGLIDIGGGTTDLAIFYDGSIRHTGVIGLGGKFVTSDIAHGLRTPLEQAENIKLEHGCCHIDCINQDEEFVVPGVGGREPRRVSRTILTRIIQPRMEEIFRLTLNELKRSDYIDLLTSGIVLTGGASLIDGAAELAESVFDMPARIGIPDGFTGLVDKVKNPMYATAVGLVQYGEQNRATSKYFRGGDDTKLYNKIHSRMKQWFAEFF